MSTAQGAVRAAAWAFVIAFGALLANGRAIGSGDTNAVERTAGSLVERGTLILPEGDPQDPFTRPVPGGRISIYPVLPALLAAPLFALFSVFFDLSLTGLQAAGKLSAALLSAGATSVLAWSFAKRASPRRALGAALLFGLGTSAYSTAQALWQHPAVLFFLVVAVSALERLEASAGADDRQPAALVAALFLSLAGAARPAAIPICGALFLFLLWRAPSRRARLIGVAGLPAALVAIYNAAFFGAPWRFGAAASDRFLASFPESIAGLLISPGRGLFVFTPVAFIALVGLAVAARRTILARGLLAAVAVHFLFTASWNEWHGGESFGPRLLTDLLPALFFYLPEGLLAWPVPGAALGLFSVFVQFLGGWTYDYRWERLHQRGQEFDTALWSWREAPIAFALREGVVVQGIPHLDQRRLSLRPRRSVPFGGSGSTIEATATGLRLSGSALVRDVRLERGARISGGWMTLAHPGDALAFRSDSSAGESLRLIGSLQGELRVEASSGTVSIPLAGDFDLTLPLRLARGDDVFVRAQKGELRLGRAEITGSGTGLGVSVTPPI